MRLNIDYCSPTIHANTIEELKPNVNVRIVNDIHISYEMQKVNCVLIP